MDSGGANSFYIVSTECVPILVFKVVYIHICLQYVSYEKTPALKSILLFNLGETLEIHYFYFNVYNLIDKLFLFLCQICNVIFTFLLYIFYVLHLLGLYKFILKI